MHNGSSNTFTSAFILLICIACNGAEFAGKTRSQSADDTSQTGEEIPKSSIDSDAKSHIPKTDTFAYLAEYTPEKVDILIVLDNSVSMVTYATRIANAFAAVGPDVYPRDVRIGVITTMAADPTNLAEPHKDINRYVGITKEPGFLELVTAGAVANFKPQAASPMNIVYDKYPVCEQGWFQPADVDTKGDRCILAALQNPFHPVGCEPAPLALQQYMTKFRGKSPFRAGAIASVIIVSDEQEQCVSVDTTTQLPTAAELMNQAITEANVTRMVISGIIPTAAPATAPATSNTSRYHTLIAESGGMAIDIKEARTSYTDVIARFLLLTRKPIPDFDLSDAPAKIVSVRVNGVKVDNYALPSQRSIRVRGLEKENGPVKIEVEYIAK